MIVTLSVLFIFDVKADTLPQANNIVIENENYYRALPKYHWEESNGKWYYKDEYGQVKRGKFYDEYGDIYDTGDNQEGYIIVSAKNSAGEEFDESGRLMNQGLKGSERFYNISKDYEKGRSIQFNDIKDFKGFLEYYQTQYSLFNLSSTYYIDSNSSISNIGANAYNKDLVVRQIMDKFGTINGDNDYAKIYLACNKVRELITYDESYTNKTLKESLDNNSGVCWHFAKITSVLLNDAGVYNELVVGKFQNSADYHMWLRCKVNNKWIYTDPTFFTSTGDEYFNINYQTYIKYYNNLAIISLN